MEELNFKEVHLFPKKTTVFAITLISSLAIVVTLLVSNMWNTLKEVEKKHVPIIERSSINVRLINLIESQIKLSIDNKDSSYVQQIKLNHDSLIQNYNDLKKLASVPSLSQYSYFSLFDEFISLLKNSKFELANSFIKEKQFVESLDEFAFEIYDQTENLSVKRDKDQQLIQANIEKTILLAFFIVLFLGFITYRVYFGYAHNLQERLYAEEKAMVLSNQRQTLVHVLCHDLGNPVSAIYGLIETAAILPENEKEKILETIKNNAEASLDIIELTKKMQALETGKLSTDISSINLLNSIEKSLSIFEEKIKNKSIKIINNVDQEVYVQAEETSLIHSVLNNIISNSIKFLNKDGLIEFNLERNDQFIILKISDNGIGIPKDILENIFSETKITTRSGTDGEKGTGFGMPLVKKFMHAYKGSIEIVSEQGAPKAGTTSILKFLT